MIHNTKISLIAAIGKNRELGKDNKLLWNIPEDLQRFKEITKGHPIIMGRKTFESIGRVLPNRANIIITRQPEEYRHSELVSEPARSRNEFGMTIVQVVGSLEEAIEASSKYYVESSKYDEKKDIPNTKYLIPNTDEHEVFIIGGGQIFEQAIGMADKLYLTIVDGEYEADTFFPEYSKFSHIAYKRDSSYNGISYTFLDLTKN